MLLQGLLECNIKSDSSYCCVSLLFLLVGLKVNNTFTLSLVQVNGYLLFRDNRFSMREKTGDLSHS